MILLYDKKYDCPNCKSEFTTKKPLSSKLRVEKVETDNHKLYKYVSPYIYEINVCPYCGFAFGEKANKNCDIKKTEKLLEYFLSVKDFSKLNQERNIDDALRTFKLALYIAQIIAEPYYVRAGLSLKIAWLYREKESWEDEIKYLSKSYENYKKSYTDENFELAGYKRYFMFYTLAELSWRLDNYEGAKLWYGELFAEKNVPRLTMNNARDSWMEYKNQRKKAND